MSLRAVFASLYICLLITADCFLPSSKAGTISLMNFHLQFKTNKNYILAWLNSGQCNRYKILDMPRQLCCRGMCKNLYLLNFLLYANDGQTNFGKCVGSMAIGCWFMEPRNCLHISISRHSSTTSGHQQQVLLSVTAYTLYRHLTNYGVHWKELC